MNYLLQFGLSMFFRKFRFKAPSLRSSMRTAANGIKNRIPKIPNNFPPIIAAINVYKGGRPTEPPTTLG